MTTDLVRIHYSKKFIGGMLDGLVFDTSMNASKDTYNNLVAAEKEKRLIQPCVGSDQYIVLNVTLNEVE
jgi:hypothetical protein